MVSLRWNGRGYEASMSIITIIISLNTRQAVTYTITHFIVFRQVKMRISKNLFLVRVYIYIYIYIEI